MSTETKNELVLVDFKALPAYVDARANQEKLVAENPFIAITDAKTATAAKNSRSSLKKGRTELQKGEKAIATKVAEFRKDVKDETETLISITKAAEDKQDEEVKRWEKIKADEKAEKERKEEELRLKHKQTVKDFKSKWEGIVKQCKLEEVDAIPEAILKEAEELEVGDFTPSVQIALEEIQEKLVDKKEQLQIESANKIESDRLEKEKKELEAKQKIIDDKEAELKKEADKKAAKEKEIKDKEAKELKDKKDAQAKLEKEEKEKKDKEAADKKAIQDKADEEKRQNELKPDKEKAADFINSFDALLDADPNIKDENVAFELINYVEKAKELQLEFINKINNL